MIKPTQRLPDWMSRLDAFVRTVWDAPFEWGQNDCCTVAAGVVQACTGVDAMADLRGSYEGELGAARPIKRLGGLDHALTTRLGPVVPVAMAQAGDIGLGDDGRLVFCGGAHWKGPGDFGLVTTNEPVKVWRCHE